MSATRLLANNLDLDVVMIIIDGAFSGLFKTG